MTSDVLARRRHKAQKEYVRFICLPGRSATFKLTANSYIYMIPII